MLQLSNEFVKKEIKYIMKKYLLSFCLIIFAAFIGLSGFSFSANAEAERTIGDDYFMISQYVFGNGSVVQKYDFALNSPHLGSLGLTKGEIEAYKDKLISNFDHFREEHIANFTLLFMQNEDKKAEYAIGNDLKISKTLYSAEYDNISFSITFENQEVWKFYSSSRSSSSEQPSEEKPVIEFISKEEASSKFPFAQEINYGSEKITVARRYKNAYLNAFEGSSIYSKLQNSYKPDFVYNYATVYNKIKSDSDLRFVDNNGFYHHVWIREEGELENATVTLSITNANRGWWYLVALVGTIGLSAISIGIAFLIKKKKIIE